MATGDATNMLRRLRSLIPGGWFGGTGTVLGTSPVHDGILGGLSDALTWLYALLAAVRLQTRVATAQGWFLDLIGWDFFGTAYLRFRGESDDNWRARIVREVKRERQTRKGIAEALVDLTGRAPQIFEPWNPGDCGAYGVGTVAYAGVGYGPTASTSYSVPSTGGFGEGHAHFDQVSAPTGNTFAGAGCYGSTALPFQIFVTAFRPIGLGVPNIQGFGYGGYGAGGAAYADMDQVEGDVTDADIYRTVAANTAAGVTPWTAIES